MNRTDRSILRYLIIMNLADKNQDMVCDFSHVNSSRHDHTKLKHGKTNKFTQQTLFLYATNVLATYSTGHQQVTKNRFIHKLWTQLKQFIWS
jgi:hypothetical protein